MIIRELGRLSSDPSFVVFLAILAAALGGIFTMSLILRLRASRANEPMTLRIIVTDGEGQKLPELRQCIELACAGRGLICIKRGRYHVKVDIKYDQVVAGWSYSGDVSVTLDGVRVTGFGIEPDYIAGQYEYQLYDQLSQEIAEVLARRKVEIVSPAPAPSAAVTA